MTSLQLNVGELEDAKKQLFHRGTKGKEIFFLCSSEKLFFSYLLIVIILTPVALSA